jgi:hypothetical protein
MTVYSKVSYDEQDDGRILKVARKQQCIMFPASTAFLNDKVKAELDMKTKKGEDEDEVQFFFIKVLIDAMDKDSKNYTVKIWKYDMGSPEDFLKLRTTLNEQIKNNGFAGNYEMVVNLAQAMLVGRSLDVKLLPLPQPQLRARMDAQTNPSAQRATQLRSVLARACSVSIQNLNTTTVP